MKTILLYSLLITTAFAQPTRETVLSGVRDYLGGMEAWSKINSIQSRGAVIIGDDVQMQIDVYRKRPAMMRGQLNMEASEQKIQLGVKDGQPWMLSQYTNAQGETITQPMPVDGTARWRMLAECQFGWPIHLVLEPSTLCDLSTQEPPEEGLVGLEMQRENWFGTLWVEPESWEPRYVSYQNAAADEAAPVQTARLGDWRIHNGIRFPYRIFILMDQANENRFILESMQINKGILSSYFDPPKEFSAE